MSPTKELHLLGVSFRTAPASVREALSFSGPDLDALLVAAKERMPNREAVVVSTCNRTEFYLAAAPGVAVTDDWLAHLRQLRPSAPILRKDCHLYQLHGAAVVEHLFRVACGLDSAVLGDAQILGQVKEALRIASVRGCLGGYLQRAFNQALEAGRRARRETAISSGAAGVGSALAGIVAGRVANGAKGTPTIVLIGAGETAQGIAYQLAKRGSWRFIVINRNEERALALANRYGGSARPWSALPAAIAEADVVIAATSAPQPFLCRTMLEAAISKRRDQPLLVVDAGLPRNVEPGAAVDLIDIDTIREEQEKSLAVRRAAVPAVEEIVAAELQTWAGWCAARPLEHSIKQLFQDVAGQRDEMARQLAASSALPIEQADRLVWQSLRQTLHRHARRLREIGITN